MAQISNAAIFPSIRRILFRHLFGGGNFPKLWKFNEEFLGKSDADLMNVLSQPTSKANC